MMIMVELIKAGSRLYHQYDDEHGVDQGWYQQYENYYYHHHNGISHFSALAGKYSPILGCSN